MKCTRRSATRIITTAITGSITSITMAAAPSNEGSRSQICIDAYGHLGCNKLRGTGHGVICVTTHLVCRPRLFPREVVISKVRDQVELITAENSGIWARTLSHLRATWLYSPPAGSLLARNAAVNV